MANTDHSKYFTTDCFFLLNTFPTCLSTLLNNVSCFPFQSEMWMTEGNNLLISLGQRVNQCRNPAEVNELIRPINRFVEEGRPLQEDRLRHISELAVQLYGMYMTYPLLCKFGLFQFLTYHILLPYL